VGIEPSSDTHADTLTSTAADVAIVRDSLRTQPNAVDRNQPQTNSASHHRESRKATETTRERDEDNESGHWCSDTGEFVIGPSGATKPAKRAMRDAADSLVAAGLAARGKMATKYTVRL